MPNELDGQRAELLDREQQGDGGVELRHLLDRAQQHQGSGAGAAELLVERQAEQVVLAEQLDHVPGELGGLVDLLGARRDPLARQLADRLQDELALGCDRHAAHATAETPRAHRRRVSASAGQASAVQTEDRRPRQPEPDARPGRLGDHADDDAGDRVHPGQGHRPDAHDPAAQGRLGADLDQGVGQGDEPDREEARHGEPDEHEPELRRGGGRHDRGARRGGEGAHPAASRGRSGAGGEQRPADRADPEDRHQRAVDSAAAVERVGHEQRQRDAEVEQHAAGSRQQDAGPDRRRPPDVGQAGPHRPGPRDVGRDPAAPVGQQQHQERRHERGRVDGEAGRRADRRQEDAAGRRAEHPGDVDDHLVQPDGAGRPLLADELEHVDLSCRPVDGQDAAAGERRREQHPDLDRAGAGEHGQEDAEDDRQALGDDQQPAPVAAVDERTGERAEHEHRAERGRGEQAEVDAAAGQLEQEPAHGDALGHRPRGREHLAQEPPAVGGDLQRRRDLAEAGPGRRRRRGRLDVAELAHPPPGVVATSVRARTSQAARQSASSACSAGLWETPVSLRTNSIAAGRWRASTPASWPA